jgi:hypothetical protein
MSATFEDYEKRLAAIANRVAQFEAYDKAEQKHRLVTYFGMIIGPLKKLAERESQPSLVEFNQAMVVMNEEISEGWSHFARVYATVDGRGFGKLQDNLMNLFTDGLDGFAHDVGKMRKDPRDLQQDLAEILAEIEITFYKLISVIRVDWPLTLSEGDKPFAFHMHLLDAVSGARARLHYFDNYLKPTFYDLYLRNLDRKLEICLVTTAGDQKYGVQAVTTVSNLFKQEFTNYRLIQVPKKTIHDRNLRIDDQVFTLGIGATDAGRQPTHFGLVVNTVAANQTLDDIIAKGTVIHQS